MTARTTQNHNYPFLIQTPEKGRAPKAISVSFLIDVIYSKLSSSRIQDGKEKKFYFFRNFFPFSPNFRRKNVSSGFLGIIAPFSRTDAPPQIVLRPDLFSTGIPKREKAGDYSTIERRKIPLFTS